jgi:lipase chaperone LimK
MLVPGTMQALRIFTVTAYTMGTGLRRYWWLFACIMALFAIAAVRYTPPSDPAPAVVHAPAPRPLQLGPGQWPDAAVSSNGQLPEIAADTVPPGGLAIDAAQRLVINRALRDVFDYFLLGGHPGPRSLHVQQLLAHLSSVLPPAAFNEAQRLVRNYLVYLDEHDQLLARYGAAPVYAEERLAAADFDRIDAWIAARARLRTSLLGRDAAEQWFAEEEKRERGKLAALRNHGSDSSLTENRNAGADPVRQPSSDMRNAQPHDTPLNVRREHIVSQFGEAAGLRFDTLERAESAWQQRYADYRRQVEQILAHAGVADIDRMRQIDILRAQSFPDEAERLRARALDSHAGPADQMR